MGYKLTIGELKTSINEDGLYSSIYNYAEDMKLDNAPAFNEPTDYTNSRLPSYTSWSNFCEFTELYDLFYNSHYGILRDHSGCVPLTKEHKKIIDKAYENFYKKCIPGFSKDDCDTNWPPEREHAARLEWLKFWVDWALENCKQPVFYNS